MNFTSALKGFAMEAWPIVLSEARTPYFQSAHHLLHKVASNISKRASFVSKGQNTSL